jgi:hypothetical protein
MIWPWWCCKELMLSIYACASQILDSLMNLQIEWQPSSEDGFELGTLLILFSLCSLTKLNNFPWFLQVHCEDVMLNKWYPYLGLKLLSTTTTLAHVAAAGPPGRWRWMDMAAVAAASASWRRRLDTAAVAAGSPVCDLTRSLLRIPSPPWP